MGVGGRDPGDAGTGLPGPRVSRHAEERWCERVGGPSALAAAELQRFLGRGRRRPRPRHWTRAHAEPGTLFVYSADYPGVCAVVCGGVVVTLLTRGLCRTEAA